MTRLPLRAPFVTDGCSMWPDGNYRSCCEEHDRAYWAGGTYQDRLAADAELYDCVRRARGPAWAGLMWLGVRIGGAFFWPVPWRWGYGYRWPRCKPEDLR